MSDSIKDDGSFDRVIESIQQETLQTLYHIVSECGGYEAASPFISGTLVALIAFMWQTKPPTTTIEGAKKFWHKMIDDILDQIEKEDKERH